MNLRTTPPPVPPRSILDGIVQILNTLGPLKLVKWVVGLAVTVLAVFIVIPNPLNKFTQLEAAAEVRDQRLKELEQRQAVIDGYIASECLDTLKVVNLVRAQVPCFRLLKDRGLLK